MVCFSKIFSTFISITVGLMFLVIGSVFFLKFDPDAYDTEVTGTIAEICESYENSADEPQLQHTVYIDYTVGDQTFLHAPYFAYHTGMRVGDTVRFYCRSDDPSQIAGTDKQMTPYYGLFAAVLGLVVLAVTVYRLVKKPPAA